MYNPPHFAETRAEVLHQLIAAHPLGALVTLTSHGLDANHIPFEFAADAGPHGTLRGHVARANPAWKNFSATVDALVIFQGPSTYITPTWYESKKEHGKVVPTYNYCVVHALGPLRVIDDPAWLRAMVGRLTERFEASRPAPWNVADAPPDFIEKQLAAIVGIEIPLTRLVGKWKVSQNRPEVDRPGIIRGLQEQGDDTTSAMAALVKNFGPRPSGGARTQAIRCFRRGSPAEIAVCVRSSSPYWFHPPPCAASALIFLTLWTWCAGPAMPVAAAVGEAATRAFCCCSENGCGNRNCVPPSGSCPYRRTRDRRHVVRPRCARAFGSAARQFFYLWPLHGADPASCAPPRRPSITFRLSDVPVF